jgi:hypothetical protein
MGVWWHLDNVCGDTQTTVKEQCEARVSSTVLREGGGEIPPPYSIVCSRFLSVRETVHVQSKSSPVKRIVNVTQLELIYLLK